MPQPAFDRRRFLAGAGALGAASALGPQAVRAANTPDAPDAPGVRFEHGVGSFDPIDTGVLLWSRATVDDPALDGVELAWSVTAPDGSTAAAGTALASPERDWTVTVEVDGLEPATTYGFRFDAPAGASAGGRTRTLPRPGTVPGRFRLGVVSCSRFAAGGFAAYRALAEREVDLVVHLGDYIYEDGIAGARAHDPPERLVDLPGYRRRYAQHRSDPDLQALHARHPVMAIWDDHELAGNAWRTGAAAHDDARDGPWEARRRAAVAAHHEWVPVRLADSADPLRTWRGARIGDLAELSCLDTRLWGRDRQSTDPALLTDPERRLLGPDQAQWLIERLRAGRGEGGTRWQLVANQVMLHPLRVPVVGSTIREAVRAGGFLIDGGSALNPDQWDGYPVERERVLIEGVGGAGDVVVLTGDVHSSWAWEGPADDGGRASMVELVTPAISSETFAERFPIDPSLVEVALRALEPDLSHVELSSHGYLVVELTPDEVHAEWWYVGRDDPASQRFGAARSARRGVPMRLVEAAAPRPEPAAVPTPTTARPGTPDADRDASALGAGERDDGGLPVAALGGGAAVLAAVVGGLLAVRRRR
jgi:alkaline phosphatase D